MSMMRAWRMSAMESIDRHSARSLVPPTSSVPRVPPVIRASKTTRAPLNGRGFEVPNAGLRRDSVNECVVRVRTGSASYTVSSLTSLIEPTSLLSCNSIPPPGKRPESVEAVAPAVEPAEKDLVIIVDDDRVAGKANVIFGEVHDLTLPAPGPVVRLSAPPPDPLGWSG